ncbi:hypothetical protein CEXT_671991 [Caerostris extrusa]|uniref:Uncharacterized protein n=1 Tax=Caerostris extrusa TaxID=172846 RepID=A0AAV4TVJ7_CAEEX|nr:hypothetical protein CEXT_671991 [Caerostris extrusa]
MFPERVRYLAKSQEEITTAGSAMVVNFERADASPEITVRYLAKSQEEITMSGSAMVVNFGGLMPARRQRWLIPPFLFADDSELRG